MSVEWKVEGPRGTHWFMARDGDEACERYRARWDLPMRALDEMCVVDVTRDGSTAEGKPPTMTDEERFDIPQRTGACKVCGWETWDGECNECEKRAAAEGRNHDGR
jgi:hypothetical protein